LTTARELIFYLQWLKARGCAAQLVAPNLGFQRRRAYSRDVAELGARVKELAAVARHYQGILSIHRGSGKQTEVLEALGKATVGKLNYKVSGELQLQLFDVLAEQPAGSPERALYERMAARCREFAARGAFGCESAPGEGDALGQSGALGQCRALGDAETGRADGNPLLVGWLGNVVGSRDVHAPDGDRRFFQEKLDALPAAVLHEVRGRNARYLNWLAENLIA